MIHNCSVWSGSLFHKLFTTHITHSPRCNHGYILKPLLSADDVVQVFHVRVNENNSIGNYGTSLSDHSNAAAVT